MSFSLPRVYPILDSSVIPSIGRAAWLDRLARSLADAGITLLEYRNKPGSDAELLADCAVLRQALPAGQVRLVLDDRAHLVLAAGFDGVHVDADDVSPSEARALLGPGRLVGTFGGSENLRPGILSEPADYLAIGPVFPTTTKDTNRPPIGIAGVRRLREQAGPTAILVAAAGITLASAPEIIASGANTVAVAAAIFCQKDPAAEFSLWIKRLD
jgi:thiamine-phosphate pyrophosphorylase